MDSVEKPSTLLGGHSIGVIARARRHRRGRDLATAYAWNVLRTLRARQWALASSGWITLLGVEHLPSGSPPRLLLVFGFVLFCPGFAIAGLLPTQEIAERWVLGLRSACPSAFSSALRSR